MHKRRFPPPWSVRGHRAPPSFREGRRKALTVFDVVYAHPLLAPVPASEEVLIFEIRAAFLHPQILVSAFPAQTSFPNILVKCGKGAPPMMMQVHNSARL